MAFNTSVFKTRALTALLFVLIMALGIFVHPYLFFLLVSIIHFGAWWEYFSLMDKISKTTSPLLFKIGMMLTGYTFLLWSTENTYLLQDLHLKSNFSIFFASVGFLLIVVSVIKSTNPTYRSLFSPSFALWYVTATLCSFLNLSSSTFYKTSITSWLPQSILLPMFVLACMWINDTMAYLVGSFIGKTPLSKISPKKTWEGTIGGAILCALVVGYAMFAISNKYFDKPIYYWIMVALLAAVLGTIGDLLESKIKRKAEVKDSGNFMPGHGGFLDRFDSLLFATPFMWLLFYFTLK